ncbi:ABC transporter substrate-binding protein [Thauera butanivorans]|uniref:ABC transporter substrate-binding protein n=1 Tax=Thauera butanivorans TaxID=86174 RepID=UPI00083882AA|nr:ABC transporter substrate-binding protein [Thauera butanivorans]
MAVRLLAALLALLSGSVAFAAAGAALPRVMSTNLCADMLVLGLAEPAQIVSVSRKSQDPRRTAMYEQARRHPANDGSAEEVLALRPDLVLASRRWQARHQAALFERHGIGIVTVPYPTDWNGIFASTRHIAGRLGRAAAGEALVADVQARIAHLQASTHPARALYLRPNGGSAGAGTYVDAVFQAAGVRNHATESGRRGWGRVALEDVVADPPDVFVVSSMLNDTTYARSGFARHPQMRTLLAERPVVRMDGNDWGCSNWQLIEAAEDIAAQLARLSPPVPMSRSRASLSRAPLSPVGAGGAEEAASARQQITASPARVPQ